jgi:4-hydroxyacetophenone monooxygenase
VADGPNTQLGHGGSAIYVNEYATAYIAQPLVAMIERLIGVVDVEP